MPGGIIGKSMNFGWIGKVTRVADNIIESRIVSDAVGSTPIEFGAPVFLNDDNTVRNILAADTTAAKFMGFAVAEVKQATSYGVSGNTSNFLVNEAADVLTRGNILVKVANGTPVAGGKLYARIAADAENNLNIGDIVCAAVTDEAIEIPNCSFTTGYVDGNGCAEVSVKTRTLV